MKTYATFKSELTEVIEPGTKQAAVAMRTMGGSTSSASRVAHAHNMIKDIMAKNPKMSHADAVMKLPSVYRKQYINFSDKAPTSTLDTAATSGKYAAALKTLKRV